MNNLTLISRDASGNLFLDPQLAVLLGAASEAAYSDYDNRDDPSYTPPALDYPGSTFNFVQRFTGFDDVIWGSGKEERYGIIYQWSADKSIYLIAFRGTSSVYDMVLDLESATTTAFQPHTNSGHFPDNINVGDGFHKIYATKNQAMSASMQEQLFSAINNFAIPASQIVITGHSLGSALASLFSLDMAVSLPKIAIANINFASPRVGAAQWQTTYNTTYGLQQSTLAIRNSYDLVPKVPPAAWPFDYKDVGEVFPVSFTVKGYHIDFPEIVLSWHSLKNYQYVVDNATLNSPQVWAGEFTDQVHSDWTMISNNPLTPSSPIEQSQNIGEIKKLIHQ